MKSPQLYKFEQHKNILENDEHLLERFIKFLRNKSLPKTQYLSRMTFNFNLENIREIIIREGFDTLWRVIKSIKSQNRACFLNYFFSNLERRIPVLGAPDLFWNYEDVPCDFSAVVCIKNKNELRDLLSLMVLTTRVPLLQRLTPYLNKEWVEILNAEMQHSTQSQVLLKIPLPHNVPINDVPPSLSFSFWQPPINLSANNTQITKLFLPQECRNFFTKPCHLDALFPNNISLQNEQEKIKSVAQLKLYCCNLLSNLKSFLLNTLLSSEKKFKTGRFSAILFNEELLKRIINNMNDLFTIFTMLPNSPHKMDRKILFARFKKLSPYVLALIKKATAAEYRELQTILTNSSEQKEAVKTKTDQDDVLINNKRQHETFEENIFNECQPKPKRNKIEEASSQPQHLSTRISASSNIQGPYVKSILKVNERTSSMQNPSFFVIQKEENISENRILESANPTTRPKTPDQTSMIQSSDNNHDVDIELFLERQLPLPINIPISSLYNTGRDEEEMNLGNLINFNLS